MKKSIFYLAIAMILATISILFTPIMQAEDVERNYNMVHRAELWVYEFDKTGIIWVWQHQFFVIIINTGNTTAKAPFTDQLFVDNIKIKTHTWNQDIPAGEYRIYTILLPVPSGLHKICVHTDYDDDVFEWNETNNKKCITRSFII